MGQFRHFLALRLETELFMNERYKVEVELNDEMWLWDLAMLCDVSHRLSILSMKLQDEQKLISDMTGAV
jgi:hypothetical protein